jgi:hypothetical protein
MIHEVLIIPGCGHTDDSGDWTPGHRHGPLHEVDIVDNYVAALCDELELSRVRYRVMETRRSPGIPLSKRPEYLEPRQLVLHCRLSWDENAPLMAPNGSTVSYSQPSSAKLARIVGESVGQWGKCYVHGHESRNPRRVEDPLLSVPGTFALTVQPFALNGRGAVEYARRFRSLGTALGWSITEYLAGRASLSKAYTGLRPP